MASSSKTHQQDQVASSSSFQASSSSSSSPVPVSSPLLFPAPCDTFEVFLSFRGEDTRHGFTDHLYTALVERGVRTFRDDEDLRRGEPIMPNLHNSIKNSHIIIPIFSKSYADSKWCLDELAAIVRCNKSIIIPVFYDVDPSAVKNQKGPFEQPFKEHDENFSTDRVKEWKYALSYVGDRAGYDLKKVYNGHEAKLIRELVKEVTAKIHKGHEELPENLIGMEGHLKHMMKLHQEGGEDVLMLGICGLGGLGKTTLAKMVYNNLIHEFYYKSFIPGIRERASKQDGLVSLQKKLISDISGETCGDIFEASQGIDKVKRSLLDKKVLVILDDVDDIEQIRALAKESYWFGSGSRIIITTRNKGVMLAHKLREDHIYEPNTLSDADSLALFSCHAFEKDVPDLKYEDVSQKITSMLGGLPLALQVIGAHMSLFRRDEAAWRDMISKLKERPDDEVYHSLKISYDGLKEEEQKIFVDIACFFIGKDMAEARYMWDACKSYPDLSIPTLERKSLLKVDERGKFQMHDLVRDMGRHVGRRSCIWKREEAVDILESSEGSKEVEGIIVDYDGWKKVSLRTKCFENLSGLRILSIPGADLQGNFSSFPKKLKWLDWSYCGLDELPAEINLEEVAVLRLKNSALKQLWARKKVLKKLKILDLRGCKNLRTLPDLSCMPFLERLILDHCKSLAELPRSIRALSRLEVLDLKACTQIKSLPKDFGELKSLKLLVLDDTNINELPTSFQNLTELELLYWRPALRKFWEMPTSFESLTEFDYSALKRKVKIPVPMITGLKQLIDLRLSAKFIDNLHDMLEALPRLRWLMLLHFIEMSPVMDYSEKMSIMKEEKRACSKILTSDNTRSPILKELRIGEPERSKVKALPRMPYLLRLTLGRTEPPMKKIWGIDETESGSSPAPSLEELTLSECDGIEALPYLPSLKRLELMMCNGLKKLWEPTKTPTELEKLCIRSCHDLLQKEECLKLHLSNLRELLLDYSFQSYLLNVQPVLPCLETLTLSGWSVFMMNTRMDDHELIGATINWLKKLPCLTKLVFNELRLVRSIRGKWGDLSNLQTLCFRRADGVEDYSISEDKQAPSQIKTLKLLGSTTNVSAIMLSNMPYLKRLEISGFYNMKSLPERMPDLPQLEQLEIIACFKLRLPSSWVEGLNHDLPNLKAITLKDCPNLRARLPQQLLNKGLEIVNCPGVQVHEVMQ